MTVLPIVVSTLSSVDTRAAEFTVTDHCNDPALGGAGDRPGNHRSFAASIYSIDEWQQSFGDAPRR